MRYEDLVSEVLPSLSADPSNPVAENAIKRSVIEFCHDSWVWKHMQDPIDLVAGEIEYDLEPVSGADVASVICVEVGGSIIEPRAVEWVSKTLPGWQRNRGTPKYFTQTDTEKILLVPASSISAPESIVVTIAMQPSARAVSFPDWIASRYMYAIVDGAASKLMLMPDKPWTDINGGADRRRLFESAIANARASAVFSLGSAPLRSKVYH